MVKFFVFIAIYDTSVNCLFTVKKTYSEFCSKYSSYRIINIFYVNFIVLYKCLHAIVKVVRIHTHIVACLNRQFGRVF